MSRTALKGYVLSSQEKEYLLEWIKKLSKVYFAEFLGFCLMGNHFHLLVRMHQEEKYSDEEICKRFTLYYGPKAEAEALTLDEISQLREKWSSLSGYVKEIKQGFSRYYNRRHDRKGFFRCERFKSVIVDNGETVINCLAYMDLSPVFTFLANPLPDLPMGYVIHHEVTFERISSLKLKRPGLSNSYARNVVFIIDP